MPARRIESVRLSSDGIDPSGVDIAIDLADGDLPDRWRGAQVVHVVRFVAHAKSGRQVLRARGAGAVLRRRTRRSAHRPARRRLRMWWRDRSTRSCGFPADSVTRGLDDKKLLGKKDGPILAHASSSAGITFPRARTERNMVKFEVACCAPCACRARSFSVGR